jgi:UPF0716 protein FxsA
MFVLFSKTSAFKIGMLALLFSLILLGDSALLLVISHALGNYVSLALVGATGLISLLFAANTYSFIYKRILNKIKSGLDCRKEFSELLGLAIGAGFILIPGLLTDFIGILLYNKPMRIFLGRILMNKMPGAFSAAYERVRSQL